MKKILIILSILLIPFVTLWDLLPEPNIIKNNEWISSTGVSMIVENIEDIDLNNGSEILDESDLGISKANNSLESSSGMPKLQDWGLGDLHFWFCNEWIETFTASLNAWVQQWEPFKVCVIWVNPSNKDISINAWVVSTEFDNMWDITCNTDDIFQWFITSWELWDITIPADNYLIKEFEITFPLGYQWEQKWCVVYHVNNPDNQLKEWESWVEIIIRKWFYMNFFVGAIDGIKNEITVSELTTNFDDNWDLILSFWVNNIWNMENTFDIQWTVNWFFGYNKKFESTDTAQLTPNKSQYFELNLWSLPSYGWKYNIDFTINGTPYFSYDISNANVDPARLEPKSWTFGTTYFKMPWLILAVVVVFILLLIVLFRKPKQKVVYVQQVQQPQQPVQTQQSQQPTQQYTQPVQPSQPVQQPVQQPTQPIQQPQQPQNPNYPQN